MDANWGPLHSRFLTLSLGRGMTETFHWLCTQETHTLLLHLSMLYLVPRNWCKIAYSFHGDKYNFSILGRGQYLEFSSKRWYTLRRVEYVFTFYKFFAIDGFRKTKLWFWHFFGFTSTISTERGSFYPPWSTYIQFIVMCDFYKQMLL